MKDTRRNKRNKEDLGEKRLQEVIVGAKSEEVVNALDDSGLEDRPLAAE